MGRWKYLQNLYREIVFAQIAGGRNFTTLQYPYSSSPQKYRTMNARRQRGERWYFWADVFVFGLFIMIICAAFAAGPSRFVHNIVATGPVGIASLVILLPVAFYRTLTRQGYLRWMYR